MPKVSIIIPFNNVENYFEQCLNSVIFQTLKDIEVILINDASNDKSKEIAKEYIEKDGRIKVIDLKTKHGQGYARNRGLEIAQGEYIGFVDSDDFIELDMFEKMYNAAKSGNTDITMCEACEYDDINNTIIKSDYYSFSILNRYRNQEVFSAIDTKDEILNINVSIWNKIYRREYLIKIKEKFPEGFIYEDLPYFFGTYLPAKRINIIWEILYYYRINRKNSTMKQVNNKVLDRIPMVSLTYEKFKNCFYLQDIKQKIQGWIINDLFHRYILINHNLHKEFFFLMKKVFKNLEIEDINNSYWKTVYHFPGYLLVVNNNFEDFNQKVFNEYLDIQEIENRLRCEILNYSNNFNDVYKNIEKCYKYSENLYDNLQKNIEELSKENKELKAEINQSISEIQILKERIREQNIQNEIYKEEMLNHVQEIINNQKKVYDEQIKNLKKEITELKKINEEIEEKIGNPMSLFFKKK